MRIQLKLFTSVTKFGLIQSNRGLLNSARNINADLLKTVSTPLINQTRMMSLENKNTSILKTDKTSAESTAGTMNDVKLKMMKKMHLNANYNPISHSREHLVEFTPTSIDQLPGRSMQDSFTSAIIPLSTDIALRDKYIGFMGNMRLGRLMEDMDMFAVWVVHQHIMIPDLNPDIPLPYTFVTILVDKIDFTDMLPKNDGDLRLTGHVSWVGKSSVEVVIWMEQRRGDVWRKLVRALFLMAARDPTNTRAAIVNPLVPRNEEETAILAGGESRKKRRQQIQRFDLLKTEPNVFESKLIHDLFIKSIDRSSKAFNKRVLPAGSVWMEDADLSTIVFSHPEDRNAHNKIFGGFLMRHALELSWALAYNFSKRLPKLEHISDISFYHPVDVSSLINMQAHVLYTEVNYMQIVVIAEVFDPVSGNQTTSNSFYYTYSIQEPLPTVIPKTYHEAIWFIDGRRKFMKSLENNGDSAPGNNPKPKL